MKLSDSIRRAGRSLRTAKARTLLTSLAIGVGAFTITLSLAAGEGGRGYTDRIVKANTDVKEIVVTQKQPEASSEPRKFDPSLATEQQGASAGPFGGGGEIAYLTDADIEKMRGVNGVATVSPNYSPNATYITTSGVDKYVVDSISTFSPSVGLEYAAGSLNDGGLKNDEIILNETYAKTLFGSAEKAVGKTVELRLDAILSNPLDPTYKIVPLTVRAVSSESGLAFRAQGSQLITNDTARDMYTFINEGTVGSGRYMIASVILKSENDAASVKDALVAKGYEAQTSDDILGTINTFINVLQAILIGFGALAVLTSVFGIINTQYISVLERTQQIGLMKALGMRRRDVGRMFKLEAAWIGFLGGAIGAGLAVLVGTIANPILSDQLSLGDIALLVFNPIAVAVVIVGLIVIAVTSGILPARKASKLDPIEALRTE